MGSENGRAELRGLYTDPAQPLTVAVGQAFDLVSMPAAVGHAAIAALRARRVRLGPVVADSRRSVMRVGFLVAPSPHSTPGPTPRTADPDSVALCEWASRSGSELGVRVGGQGSTATLPPLVPWRGWLHWLVPPGGAAGRWTPSGALLSVLSEPPRASSL
ncbi:hypothetical protein GCM10009839_16600 [Catenulispora yoronensis]|uniref:Uncharacterized protein n=1 Tax=Catenulispora yoronensis TaxID=450799 RepID=A0ABN2TUG1_9ACTN